MNVVAIAGKRFYSGPLSQVLSGLFLPGLPQEEQVFFAPVGQPSYEALEALYKAFNLCGVRGVGLAPFTMNIPEDASFSVVPCKFELQTPPRDSLQSSKIVIELLSPKGGTGKTTFVMLFLTYMMFTKTPFLWIDGDPLGQLSEAVSRVYLAQDFGFPTILKHGEQYFLILGQNERVNKSTLSKLPVARLATFLGVDCIVDYPGMGKATELLTRGFDRHVFVIITTVEQNATSDSVDIAKQCAETASRWNEQFRIIFLINQMHGTKRDQEDAKREIEQKAREYGLSGQVLFFPAVSLPVRKLWVSPTLATDLKALVLGSQGLRKCFHEVVSFKEEKGTL